MKTKSTIRIFYRNTLGWSWFPLRWTLKNLLDKANKKERTIKYG